MEPTPSPKCTVCTDTPTMKPTPCPVPPIKCYYVRADSDSTTWRFPTNACVKGMGQPSCPFCGDVVIMARQFKCDRTNGFISYTEIDDCTNAMMIPASDTKITTTLCLNSLPSPFCAFECVLYDCTDGYGKTIH